MPLYDRACGILSLCLTAAFVGCDNAPVDQPRAEDTDTEDTDIVEPDTGVADDTDTDDTDDDAEDTGADTPTDCDPEDVRGCLEVLGVTVDTESPRLGPDGEPLPEDYAPLGATVSFYANPPGAESDLRGADDTAPIGTRELFLGGVARPRTTAVGGWLELDANDVTNTWFTTDTLQELDTYDHAQSVAADLDADGREEIVGLSVVEGTLTAAVFEDRVEGFGETSGLSLGAAPGTWSAAVADADGDGDDDLVIATFAEDGRSFTLSVYAYAEGGFIEQAVTPAWSLSAPDSVGAVRLAAGNVDFDRGDEIVVVLEERYLVGDQETGKSRYWIVDDLNMALSEIGAGTVGGTIDGLPRVAELSDVVVDDFDGDGLDEIVFGGLYSRSGEGDCPVAYTVFSIEDRIDGFASGPGRRACHETSASVDAVFAQALDVDGDGRLELSVNQMIFDELSPENAWSTKYALSDAELGLEGGDEIVDGAVRFAAGDFTNDGREDLAIYLSEPGTLQIFGEANDGDARTEDGAGGWRMMHAVAIDGTLPDVAPALLSVDVDNADATVVKISDAAHQVIYTEPIVLAVLAAAPCYPEDLYGQDNNRCRTAYGSSDTTGTTVASSFSVSAGGASLFIAKGDFIIAETKKEITRRVTASVGTSWSSGYTVTKTVTYTTAPITDEVIFTAIPYDIYTYTIVSHPQPEVVGSEIVMALPREISTYKVPLDHYERNTVAGAPPISGEVFHHTAGEPLSYPTVGDKDALVQRSSELELATLNTEMEEATFLDGGVFDVRDFHELVDGVLPMGELVTMEVGPASVNPGNGIVAQSISYETLGTKTHSGRLNDILRLKVTTESVVGGGFELQVGTTSSSSFSVIRGSKTTATGTVADIPEEHHAANEYDWGLFTYLHVDPATGQQIDVVHYWVE
ncbi:MAG: FG-GAP-like repeat-containing protein [Myxococcota bacterium]